MTTNARALACAVTLTNQLTKRSKLKCIKGYNKDFGVPISGSKIKSMVHIKTLEHALIEIGTEALENALRSDDIAFFTRIVLIPGCLHVCQ